MSTNSEKENVNNLTNVFCRFRPLTKEDLQFNSEQISHNEPNEITHINPHSQFRVYTFPAFFNVS